MGITAAAVTIIASNLLLSKIMPVIPNITETEYEKIISNPPRALRGLPHPG